LTGAFSRWASSRGLSARCGLPRKIKTETQSAGTPRQMNPSARSGALWKSREELQGAGSRPTRSQNDAPSGVQPSIGLGPMSKDFECGEALADEARGCGHIRANVNGMLRNCNKAGRGGVIGQRTARNVVANGPWLYTIPPHLPREVRVLNKATQGSIRNWWKVEGQEE
jgi:hypothetical protein